MKMILFIACLLSMPIVSFLVGAYKIGIVFCVFYVCFGLVEWFFVWRDKESVSQHVWKLPVWKKVLLTVFMCIGWASLIIHLWGII